MRRSEAVVVNLTAIDHSSTITLVTSDYARREPSGRSASAHGSRPLAVQSNLAIVQLSAGGAITLSMLRGGLDAITDSQGISQRLRVRDRSPAVSQHPADPDV